jgi:prophage regulatory protein
VITSRGTQFKQSKGNFVMDIHVAATPIHILRLPQVCKVTGLCRSVVYQLEAENSFPKRIHLTARSVGWIENEIQDWLSQRIACSRKPPRL